LAVAGPPALLSEFYFFDEPEPGGSLQTRVGVERYDLVNALFTDHATKDRHLYLPPGTAVRYDATGVLVFPVGSALIKTFSLAPDLRNPQSGARRIETRVLVHRSDGWVAWPYVWDDDQKEARYAPVGARRSWQVIDPAGTPLNISWVVPNQNQCKTCHQSGDAIAPLGPTARNLNRTRVGQTGIGVTIPDALNQLDDWAHRGLLLGAPRAAVAPRVPEAFDADAPIETRARAWLDVNCAHCHQRDGSASNSGLYLGWSEKPGTTLGFAKRPVAAGRGAGDGLFVIEPAHPERSIMIHRMASTEPGVAMPELGRSVADPQGVALISAWIAGLGV
jgi:uncharacterized repeat protein (TIGR03806 family)